jgi:hypothetical protein
VCVVCGADCCREARDAVVGKSTLDLIWPGNLVSKSQNLIQRIGRMCWIYSMRVDINIFVGVTYNQEAEDNLLEHIKCCEQTLLSSPFFPTLTIISAHTPQALHDHTPSICKLIIAMLRTRILTSLLSSALRPCKLRVKCHKEKLLMGAIMES